MGGKKVLLAVLLFAVMLIAGCEDYDTSNCNQYENEFLFADRDGCWSQKAEETADASWCNNQEGSNHYCVARVAHLKNNDFSVCDQYARDTSACYDRLEEYVFDDSVRDCNSLWGDQRKVDCLVALDVDKGGTDACRDSHDRPLCYATLATARGDASLCDQLSEEESSACVDLMSGVEVPEEEVGGACKYDADCPHVCKDMHTILKPHCNGRTNECEGGFEETCPVDEVAGHSFPRFCVIEDDKGFCDDDKKGMQAKKEELSNEVKLLLATRQWTVDQQTQANNNCLSGLSDVTNQLIINTALSVASPPTKFISVAAGTTNDILTELKKDPEGMPPEEFISLNCNLVPALEQDLNVIDKKIELAQEQVRELNMHI